MKKKLRCLFCNLGLDQWCLQPRWIPERGEDGQIRACQCSCANMKLSRFNVVGILVHFIVKVRRERNYKQPFLAK